MATRSKSSFVNHNQSRLQNYEVCHSPTDTVESLRAEYGVLLFRATKLTEHSPVIEAKLHIIERKLVSLTLHTPKKK